MKITSNSPGTCRSKLICLWQLSSSTGYVVFLPSKQYQDIPVPNRFFAVAEDGELKIRGLECRRHDTPVLNRMQHEVLSILAEAHDSDSYLQKLEVPRMVLASYEERLAGLYFP